MDIHTKSWSALKRTRLGIPTAVWLIAGITLCWWIYQIGVVDNQNTEFKKQLQILPAHEDQPLEILQTPIEICDTIHITLICMGKCARDITPMLKSILHHREYPLHFHYIVDPWSIPIIDTLMETWNLPDVKYTCYNAQNEMSKVSWVPNTHYSGKYAIVKLLLPEILPNTLHQVIVLDTDLTFLCDVAELWIMFKNMTDVQFLGMVENESQWYEDTVHHWPALGRGFNAGLMLIDLRKLRSTTNWTTLWHNTVKHSLPRLKQLTLADQDVINGIVKNNPSIMYRVNCLYNVQMSMQSEAVNCYGENRDNVKIIHWNSQLRYNIDIKDSGYFRFQHQLTVNLDGNLLRQKMHRCDQSEDVKCMYNASDPCITFRAAQQIKLRTHLYYLEYSNTNVDDFDVTLVLQLSMDRLQFLERLVKHWEGPLSVAIYLSDCDVPQFERFIKDLSDTLSVRTNIGYHLVFKHDEMHYPVNYLRNVALENVNTPYVFLMDVDFVPMSGLYSLLRSAIKHINPHQSKKCLVVAAWDASNYRGSPRLNKTALLSNLELNNSPFKIKEWPKGQTATNYTKWATEKNPYEVKWQPDYEPYLVVHRSVPKYDTRFSGFEWDKVSHGVELRAQGYRLVVLPDAFVVHTSHAPSRDILAFRTDPTYRICLKLLKQEFMKDLKEKYNFTFQTEQNEAHSQTKLEVSATHTQRIH